MLSPLRDRVGSLFGQTSPRQYAAVAEFSVESVIPDLVVGLGLEALDRIPRRSLGQVDVHLLSALSASPQTREGLLASLYVTPEAADSSLHRLERQRLLERNGEGTWFCRFAPCLTGFELIAFELKLERWREALAQAEAYRMFADRSYVVLDAGRVSPTAVMLDAFAAAGVGLVLQSSHALHVAVEAAKACPVTPARFTALTRFARAVPRTLQS